MLDYFWDWDLKRGVRSCVLAPIVGLEAFFCCLPEVDERIDVDSCFIASDFCAKADAGVLKVL